jgi:hypothetical protein
VDRRRFLLTSLAGAIAVPFGAEGQQAGAVHRIGLLGPGGPGPGPEEFRRGLSELGYVEGRNIRFEWTVASRPARGLGRDPARRAVPVTVTEAANARAIDDSECMTRKSRATHSP